MFQDEVFEPVNENPGRFPEVFEPTRWATFNKPHVAIVMIPKVGSMTLVGRKMFNVMLQFTQEQTVAIRTKGEVVLASHLFSARLSDILSDISENDSNLTSLAKKALLEMRRVELDWEAPDKDSVPEWTNMSLLSEAKIVKKNGVIIVMWALPPDLFVVVADPKKFTPIDNRKTAGLTTYRAVALYEICARYRTNPGGVTSCNPVEWWIAALSQNPLKIDVDTGKPIAGDWAHYKDRHLKKTIQEVNEKTDLHIELIDVKKGPNSRKITHAQFAVSIKKLQDEKPQIKLGSAIAARCSFVGVRIADALAIKKAGTSESVIQIALDRLEARLARTDLAPVTSKISYLRTVVRELSDQIQDENPPVAPTPEAEKPLEVVNTVEEQQQLDAKSKVLAMPRLEQKELATRALLLLPSVFNTPTMIKKIHNNEWATSAPLMNQMVQLYVSEHQAEGFSTP
jgi:hypothetical protein